MIFISEHTFRDFKGNDDFFDTSYAENLKDNLVISKKRDWKIIVI